MSRTTSTVVPIIQATGTRKVTIKAEVLDDISSRFLINLSSDERADPIKLCSHIEVAHWYYLDLVRPEDHTLPACNLKEFMATVFQHCPWLVRGVSDSNKDLELLISDWKTHKYKKPLRGAILLNQDWTKCLLVQGYPSGTSWTFPKGKLEEGETDKDAAVREVFEETGYDIRVLIQKSSYLDAFVHDSNARMYIIPGVPDNTHFEAKTRKEIKNIKWFDIKDLPSYKKDQKALGVKTSSFFMVIPFIGQLRRWIQKKKGRTVSASFKIHSQVQDSPRGGRTPVSVPITQSAIPIVSGANKTLPMSVSVSAPALSTITPGRVSKVPLLGDRPGSSSSGVGFASMPPSHSANSVLPRPHYEQQRRVPAPPAAFQGQSAMPPAGPGPHPHQSPMLTSMAAAVTVQTPVAPPQSSFGTTLRPGAIPNTPRAIMGSSGAILNSPSSFQQQQQQSHLKGAPPIPFPQGLLPQQQQQQQQLARPKHFLQQPQQPALAPSPRQPISVPPTHAPRPQPGIVPYLQQQQPRQAPPPLPTPRLPPPAADFLRLSQSRLPQNPLLHPGSSSAQFVTGTTHQQHASPLPNSLLGVSNPQRRQNFQQQQQRQQFQGSVPVRGNKSGQQVGHHNILQPGLPQQIGVAMQPPNTQPPNTQPLGAMQPPITQPLGVAMQPPSTQPVGMAMHPPSTQPVGVAMQPPSTQPVGMAMHPLSVRPVGVAMQPQMRSQSSAPHHGPVLGTHSQQPLRPAVPDTLYQMPPSKRAPLLPYPSGGSPEPRPRTHQHPHPRPSMPHPPFQPAAPRGPKAPLLPLPIHATRKQSRPSVCHKAGS